MALTHTQPFNGPFSRTTRVGRKGKTNLDFTEARDSEWQWHQLGHMQVCTLLQTDNHASTQPVSFIQAGCPSCCPTNSVRAHTHTRLTAFFLGVSRSASTRKVKTNLDFTGARDSECQWHQLGHMQVCTSLQTDNHASTPPLSFYRPDALPAAQPTASTH